MLSKPSRSPSLVSVIIPTYNSKDTLGRCLESLKKQTYSMIEIICVDKGSRDGTIDIAIENGAKIVVLGGRERSEQKNLGTRQAHGDYVYFVDSDFILEPKVIEEAVSRCEREGYQAIIIHNSSDPSVSLWARIRKFERDFSQKDELNVAARFLLHEVFDAIGGFDESMVAGEDYDLHNRLLDRGYKVGRISAMEVHLGEPKSISDVARKHYYYGRTIRAFIVRNRVRAIKQLSPVRHEYLRHWREFAHEPILFSGFLIYQAVRYFSAGLGYLISIMNVKM